MGPGWKAAPRSSSSQLGCPTHGWPKPFRAHGTRLLAQGAFAGIRNIATHSDDEWSEQVALEHLAVLSVVARWADDTELATAR
jgi:hypothetical protein